jgi:colanic acid/amylovoran biosynthesis protein
VEISFFGAPGDTHNLGVSALRHSLLVGLLQREPNVRITAFDFGLGRRREIIPLGSRNHVVVMAGARSSRRVYRPESYVNLRASARLGGHFNAGARALLRATAVLDVSGGDSFSDIYGLDAFEDVMAPKELALDLQKPLVLLPQTYGPYDDDAARLRARRVIARASTAWSRDDDSFARLRDLLGADFDPSRHRAGVEMAFGMRPQQPSAAITTRLEDWITPPDGAPSVGVNVSGLTYFADQTGRDFALKVDYRRLLHDLVYKLVDRGARVLLLAHVLGRGGTESDEDANADLIAALPSSVRSRVSIAPNNVGPNEIKWVISRADWFCGTRMHACVAALSAGVATASIAYSLKTRGVFATYGQEGHVADARTLGTEEALEVLLGSFETRLQAKDQLREAHPVVAERASQQMDDIVDHLRGLSNRTPRSEVVE